MDVRDNQFARGKPSTRLFAPPGGSSNMASLISGGAVPYAETKLVQKNNQQMSSGGAPWATDSAPSPVKKAAPVMEKKDIISHSPEKKVDAKTSVRVRQPPGGSSTIFFG
eukprot:GDKI01034120.1.p3 GENE.GDKI01034120.1~~GDKI01034120.1.p3  ORF type:complete len:110 (+),score=44.46 GDKI01034120.1:85-414(+)